MAKLWRRKGRCKACRVPCDFLSKFTNFTVICPCCRDLAAGFWGSHITVSTLAVGDEPTTHQDSTLVGALCCTPAASQQHTEE